MPLQPSDHPVHFLPCLIRCNGLGINVHTNSDALGLCSLNILNQVRILARIAGTSPSSVSGTDNSKFNPIVLCLRPVNIFLITGYIHTISYNTVWESGIMYILIRYCTHCCNTILFLHFLPILRIICILRVYFRFILRLIHSLGLRCLWCIWRRFCVGSLLCWYNRSTFCLNNCFCLRFCGILRAVSDIYHNSLLSALIVRCSRICKSW